MSALRIESAKGCACVCKMALFLRTYFRVHAQIVSLIWSDSAEPGFSSLHVCVRSPDRHYARCAGGLAWRRPERLILRVVDVWMSFPAIVTGWC